MPSSWRHKTYPFGESLVDDQNRNGGIPLTRSTLVPVVSRTVLFSSVSFFWDFFSEPLLSVFFSASWFASFFLCFPKQASTLAPIEMHRSKLRVTIDSFRLRYLIIS